MCKLQGNNRSTPMQAFICDAQRTPIGRYGGALSSVRADDLAATSSLIADAQRSTTFSPR